MVAAASRSGKKQGREFPSNAPEGSAAHSDFSSVKLISGLWPLASETAEEYIVVFLAT